MTTFLFLFFISPGKTIWMRKIFTSATIWLVWIFTFGINNKNSVFSFDMFPSCYISHFIWCIEALPSGILINLLALQRRRVLLKDSHEVFVRTRVQHTVLSRSKYNSVLAYRQCIVKTQSYSCLQTRHIVNCTLKLYLA